ncbi:MAG: ATP phosphoribosyltransferase, partial [Candidatus Marinimicrobia bacterium]|nr:ATP phosphoribosyltransferase [Candidatus Neomarinimicrobiota bacterium]
MLMPKILKMGLPKGSLQESTLSIFKKAGWNFIISSRTYNPYCDDPELEAMFIRAQEIARYVEQGIFDAGITGLDWVLENGADVVEVCELVYAKASMRPVRWVLAVPEESSIQSVADLEGKHISTEVVNLTRRYLEEHNVTAEVEFSWGATEAKARLLSDAIVEVTETGSSLRANKLRIVDTILESTTRLIANRRAFEDRWKRRKIENMALLLQAGIMATSRVGLKMNVTDENLEKVMAVLPAMKTPTVSQLYNGSGAAIEVIVEESTVREIIPSLIKAGASDIIEYPLN